MSDDQPRDTYRYHPILDRKIVHRGITNDLSRREQEHQQEFPGSKIKQIGLAVTRDSALEWERDGGKAI